MRKRLGTGWRIASFDALASTQGEMRARLERGEDVDGLVIRAARQTRGRGRRGRVWQSAAGGSYQTLALRDPQPPRLGRGGSAVAVAVGIAAAFNEHGLQLRLKWPNDLLYRERKLGGILTEYARGHLLVGVGLNVANDPPADAAALRGWDLEAVHGVVLDAVQRGLERWLDDPEDVAVRFAAYDALAGRRVRVETQGHVVAGTARGVDGRGCLLVDGGSGPLPVCCGSVRVAGARAA